MILTTSGSAVVRQSYTNISFKIDYSVSVESCCQNDVI